MKCDDWVSPVELPWEVLDKQVQTTEPNSQLPRLKGSVADLLVQMGTHSGVHASMSQDQHNVVMMLWLTKLCPFVVFAQSAVRKRLSAALVFVLPDQSRRIRLGLVDGIVQLLGECVNNITVSIKALSFYCSPGFLINCRFLLEEIWCVMCPAGCSDLRRK